MRAIFVGCGGVTRALLHLLSEAWQVTIIDPDENALALAVQTRPTVISVVGDGSSPVVLRRAGIASADALVAVSDDDDVNIAACTQARDAGVARIAAGVKDPERIPEYAGVGVNYFDGAQIAAARIARALEPRGIVTAEFAAGRAVAIEFHLAGDSPVRGRALRDIPREHWVAGAILRDDALIIPSGDTVFAAGDIVTVLGPAGQFSEIVRAFTAGEARFPLEYGTTVAVTESGPEISAAFIEAAYLAGISRAEALMALIPNGDEHPGEALPELITKAAGRVAVDLRRADFANPSVLRNLLDRESVGVLAVPAPGSGLTAWLSVSRRVRLAARHDIAVLLCRGRHPYQRIVVPARHTLVGRAAARAGIDLARAAGAELVAVAVVEPSFVRGSSSEADAQAALSWIKDEASAQGVAIRADIRHGNPVHVLRAEAANADLVVLGARAGSSALHVSVASHVARSTAASVLLVPAPG